jgi:hypothetical protein
MTMSRGADYSLTENAASPFQAERTHKPAEFRRESKPFGARAKEENRKSVFLAGLTLRSQGKKPARVDASYGCELCWVSFRVARQRPTIALTACQVFK